MNVERAIIDHFGRVDAAATSDSDLAMQHKSHSAQERLKYCARQDGKQIVVGIRGSGKTDLRRFVARTDPNAIGLEINRNMDYVRIDARDINRGAGSIESALTLLLLAEFWQEVITKMTGAPQVVERLREAGGPAMEILKRLSKAVDFKAPFATIDLEVLFEPRSSAIVETAWRSLAEAVRDAFSDVLPSARGYILIDDVDDVFEGIGDNPSFIEGLWQGSGTY